MEVSTRNIIIAGVIAAFGIKYIVDEIQEPDTVLSLCDQERDLTYDESVYLSLADVIQDAIWNQLVIFIENDSAIANALMECQTIDDVIELICAYDERTIEDDFSQTFFSPQSLPTAVTNFLNDDYIELVNTVYEQRGIDYIWIKG